MMLQYRSFNEKGNPTLKTTLTVMQALGLSLTIKSAHD
jgi:DNA-binding phage protein